VNKFGVSSQEFGVLTNFKILLRNPSPIGGSLMIVITKDQNGEVGEIGDLEWKGENPLKHGETT
jgi:hypothetical protein